MKAWGDSFDWPAIAAELDGHGWKVVPIPLRYRRGARLGLPATFLWGGM